MRHSLQSRHARLMALAILASSTLLGVPLASADTVAVWSGATSTDWGTGSNWDANGLPSATNAAEFSTTVTNLPTLGAPATAEGIWLTKPASGNAQNVTIGNSAANLLTLTGTATLGIGTGQTNAGIIMDDTGGHNLTIAGPVATSNTTGFYVNEGGSLYNYNNGTLTLSSTLAIAPGSTLTLGGNNSGSTLISGAVSGNNANIVINANNGRVTLAASNTYTGTTTLNSGTLSVGNAAALSGSSNLLINGGTINIGSTLTGNTPMTWGGNFTINNGYDQKFGTGAVTLTTTPQITTVGNSQVTVGGVISGSYGLTLTNACSETLILTGISTYQGTTTINGGTLRVGSVRVLDPNSPTIVNAGGALDLNSQNVTASSITLNGTGPGNNGALTNGAYNQGTLSCPVVLGSNVSIGGGNNGNTIAITGAISDGGHNYSITKVNTGTLRLTTSNNFGGGVILNAGALDIRNSGALGSGTLTINGGTIYNGSAAAITLNTVPITISGSFGLTSGSALNTGLGAVTLSSATPTITNSNSAGNLIIGGPIGDSGAGLGLTMNANGATLSLAGANTYTGNTTLTAGTLTFSNAAAIASGSRLVINGGTLRSSYGGSPLTLSTNPQQTWAGNFTFDIYGPATDDYLNLGQGAVNLTSGIAVNVANGHLTVGGAIGDGSATYGLTKSGGGTLILTGPNTYKGGTTLSAGTLGIDNASAVGTGPLTIAGGTIENFSGTPVTLSTTGAQTWSGDFACNNYNTPAGMFATDLNLGTGPVTLTGTRTLTIDGVTLTVGGSIGDGNNGYGITKANGGKLVLAGSNTYKGLTTVNGGTLILANNQALGATGGATVVNSGAVLDLNGRAIGAGPVTIYGTGLSNFPQGVLINSNTTTAASLSGNVTLGSASNVGGPGQMALSGNITGGFGLTKIGTGNTTLSGSNTYTGTTTVSTGTLQFAKEASLYGGLSGSWTAANITVAQNATLALNVGGTGEFTATDLGILLGLGTGTTGFVNGSAIALDTSNAPTGGFTYGGVIANPNAGATALQLIKIGSGILTLTNTNTYTGTTIINAGELNASSLANMGNGGTLTLNGGTLQFGAVFDPSPRSTTFGPAGGTFDTNGFNITLGSPNLIGSGSLTKVGLGTLKITAAESYSGGTIVTAGTVSLSGGNNRLASTGAITIGGGTLDLNNTNQSSGTLTLQSGTIAATGATTGGIITATSYALQSGTITATLGGSGALTKTTAGTVTLSNLPTGSVAISGGGILQVTAGSAPNVLETITSLSVSDAGSVLDLTNHDLLVQGGLANGLTLVSYRGKITTNTLVDGAPNAPTTIALVSGQDYKAVTGTSTLGDNDLYAKFTYKGDADLDGKITANDYLALDLGYLFGLTGWTHGDFEQTGLAPTAQDFADIDLSYQNQSGVTAAASEIKLHTQWFGAAYTSAFQALTAPAAVPEPTSLGLLALGAMGLLGRRRR